MANPTNLCDLFFQTVEKWPDNIAVDHAEGCLTYRELDTASSAVAGDLQRLGVTSGSTVLLITSHGSFNLVAILSILKTGACFVPMDCRRWSQDNINYVYNLVERPVVVNTTPEAFHPPQGDCEIFNLSALPTYPAEGSQLLEGFHIQPEDTACIIFTSGSTGRPKGVKISHKSLCVYSRTSPVNMDIVPGDRLLHILSVGFDACTCMLFSVLGNGGTVVPSEAEDIYQRAPSCTVLAATPSLLAMLPTPSTDKDMYPRIHTILVGGETASPDLFGAWVDAGVRVLAAYGGTETTALGCVQKVKRDPKTGKINPFLIGGCMRQSPCWLVRDNLAAIDEEYVDGEIIIGGDGLSNGYYKNEEKTSESFITWNGLRVYRTGDYGRWVQGPSGDRVIEFRGRRDRTVKNSGFLVNLDQDIEDGLLRVGHPLGVRTVHAAWTENGIIAVITPSSVDIATLLSKANESMCSYFIPYMIKATDSIPLSPNGKIQSQQLLAVLNASNEREANSIAEHAEVSTHPEQTELDRSSLNHQFKLERVLEAASEVFEIRPEKLKTLRGGESFNELGGSSLVALKFVSVLRRLGVQSSVRDIFKHQTLSSISQYASVLPSLDSATIESARDPTAVSMIISLREQTRELLGLDGDSFDVGPLTSFQLELALPTLMDDSKYVNQIKLSYTSSQSVAMERAWRVVWQSEPIFRTEISLAIGSGVQVVHRCPFRKPGTWNHDSHIEYKRAVDSTSLAVGLGCSLDFFRYGVETEIPNIPHDSVSPTGEEEALTVVLTIHHSLMDGCSLELILGNVERAALGLSIPPSVSAIDTNLGLIDIQTIKDQEVRSFFHDYLDGLDTHEDIIETGSKGDSPDPKATAVATFEASVGKYEAIQFAQRNGVSVACLYMTAWAMALSVLDMNPTVVVGSVFSSRGAIPNHENAVGAYISTLPLVFRFIGGETIVSLLQRAMDDLAVVGKYAWARSDQIGTGFKMRNLVAMQPNLHDEHPRTKPIRVESLDNSDFPLSLLVDLDGKFRILYDDYEFEHKTIRRVGENFQYSLHAILNATLVEECMKLNQLQERVIQTAKQVQIEPDNLTVKQVLEQSIDKFGPLVALEDCLGTSLTYGDIDRLSNAIAHHILAHSSSNVIAIYGDGTIQWILALLGVVKSGNTFVPIDPNWPMERREAVCEKSGATAMLLYRETQEHEAPVLSTLKILIVDNIIPGFSCKEHIERLPDTASPSSDFVVVFTSGSTGTPKGIPISNRGLLTCQSNLEANLYASPERRIAQFMSPAFDACNVEIFSTFLHGATLVLRDPVDPYAHLSRANTVMATPSALAAMDADELSSIDMIISTGEALTSALVEKFASRVLLYNAYGPAECSVLATYGRMIPGDTLTIGAPLDTVRIYILDEDKNQVPYGDRGEIYLAGKQVLRGYINDPDKSAQQILLDPWHTDEHMFRTRDYGTQGQDGRLIYHGRIDRVAKIRGFRVELAGVECAIMSCGGISHCAAIAVNGTLVAYITCDKQHEASDASKKAVTIRERLCEMLSTPWIPSAIVPLGHLPKTPNGKVDSKALEALYTSTLPSPDSGFRNSLGNSISDKLAVQWRQVLRLGPEKNLEDDDDFFRLGGHSILLMLLATRLTAAFSKKVRMRDLVASPSFRGQCDAIQRLLHGTTSDAIAPVTEKLPPEGLTELERQVWFQYQVATTVTTFNIACVLHVSGKVDPDNLTNSLNMALASDPVLSCHMAEGANGPKRVISDVPPKVRQVSPLDLEAEVNYRFDLEQDTLIRVHLVRAANSESTQSSNTTCQLVIVTSHAIADLGTLQNLLRLTSIALAGGTVTHHDTPQHLESPKWTQRPSLEEKSFWRNYLSGHSYNDHRPSLLRHSFLPSPLATFQGASRSVEYSGQVVTTLNKCLRRFGITHHQMALVVAALLLQWLSGEDDIVLGAPNANRSTPKDEEALGQFLDRLPIRVRLPRHSNQHQTKISTVLVDVRNSALKALAHAISFSDVLAVHGFPNGHLHHPLFECMVTFHTRSSGLDNWLQIPGCHVSSSPQFANGSKFPFMMEWFELANDRWSVHLEHDTSYIPPGSMGIVEKALGVILKAMADECSLSDLHDQLGDLKVSELDSAGDSPPSSSGAGSPRSSDSSYSISVDEMADTIRSEMSACLGPTSKALSKNGSFFSAGADSMAVMSLRHRMRRLGIDLPVRSIFVGRTPLKLAELVLL